MMFGLRELTSGCALAAAMGLMNPVMAGPVTLDFEGLPLGSPVGTAYTDSGLEFTGNNQVKDTFATVFPSDPANLRWVVSDNGFTIDVVNPTATPFNSLSFDYAGGLFVYVYDTNGKKTTTQIDQALFLDWYAWDPILLDKSTRIDYVEFARNNSAGGQFAIDNVVFSLQPGSITPPPNPNPVPEPAGFALAALALLGVGLMSRRRR